METHNEDYYWLTGEVEDEVEFLQDLADDGLFLKPSQNPPLSAVIGEYYVPISHMLRGYLEPLHNCSTLEEAKAWIDRQEKLMNLIDEVGL